ncbi:MAG: hypothetical protein U5L96_21590 [Owenweeksia sp.]|nr:hypothetical protein [Owenweeksia sp.]
MGHLMGLVNTGTPMVNGHEDGSHVDHCNDDQCLMYWAVQSADAIGNLLGNSNPSSLDSQCRADIKANGGK